MFQIIAVKNAAMLLSIWTELKLTCILCIQNCHIQGQEKPCYLYICNSETKSDLHSCENTTSRYNINSPCSHSPMHRFKQTKAPFCFHASGCCVYCTEYHTPQI